MREKNAAKPREKWNFKPWLIVIGAIALVLLTVVGIYYGGRAIDNAKAEAKVVQLEYRGGSYYDPKSGITYIAAPRCYSYVAISKERYAKSERLDLYYATYKDDDGNYHVDPEKWLTSDLEHGAIVYCADSIELPETKDFKWESMLLCNPDGKLFATQEFGYADTNALLSAYYGADESENLYDGLYGMSSLDLLKEIRVVSSEYKYIHLILYLFTDGEKYYIGSAYDHRLIETDAGIFGVIFGEK